MSPLNNDKFLIIKNIKNFIIGLEKILITFPKKDILTRNLIYSDSLELLEIVYKANYENDASLKHSYQIAAIARINKIDFYLERAYKFKYISEKQCLSKTEELLRILNTFSDALSALNIDELSEETLKSAVDSTYSQFTDHYAFDKSDKKAAKKIKQAGENANNYYTICHFHDKGQLFDGSGDSFAVSVSNLLQVFMVNLFGTEDDKAKISDNSCPLIDLSSITLTDAEDKKAHDEWQAEYDSMVEERSGIEEQSSLVLDAEEEKLINFYDAIFENIETNGWTYNEYIGDTEYLNDVLQNGMYNITKAEKGDDGSWVYDESCPTTCQNVYQVSDSGAENRATAEYEAKKRNLQRKEEAVDTKMQKLETEQNAINQMLESYRSIIDEKTENLNVFT